MPVNRSHPPLTVAQIASTRELLTLKSRAAGGFVLTIKGTEKRQNEITSTAQVSHLQADPLNSHLEVVGEKNSFQARHGGS